MSQWRSKERRERPATSEGAYLLSGILIIYHKLNPTSPCPIPDPNPKSIPHTILIKECRRRSFPQRRESEQESSKSRARGSDPQGQGALASPLDAVASCKDEREKEGKEKGKGGRVEYGKLFQMVGADVVCLPCRNPCFSVGKKQGVD